MQLREFTLITPTIEAGQVFKAIESAISIKAINDTIAQSDHQTHRGGVDMGSRSSATMLPYPNISFTFCHRTADNDR